MDLRTQDSSSAPAYDYGQQSLGSKNETQGSDIHEIHEALTPPSVPHSQEKAWQTGFLRNVPWLGLGALLLVLCSIIASTAILVISNGDAVSTWRIAPSVILALLTSLSTACFGLALASGINVTWWRRMLQGGNLDDIHYYWEQGSSLWAAATAGRRSSLLSISKLFIAVAAIAEGPLLQRATTIAAREVSRPFSLQAALAVNLFPVTTAQLLEESTIPNYPLSQIILRAISLAPTTTIRIESQSHMDSTDVQESAPQTPQGLVSVFHVDTRTQPGIPMAGERQT
jgi:hypothetical protein